MVRCGLCGAEGFNRRTCPLNDGAARTRLHNVPKDALKCEPLPLPQQRSFEVTPLAPPHTGDLPATTASPTSRDVPDAAPPNSTAAWLARRNNLRPAQRAIPNDFTIAAVNVDATTRFNVVRTVAMLEQDIEHLLETSLAFPDFVVVSELPNNRVLRDVAENISRAGFGGEARYETHVFSLRLNDRLGVLWNSNRWKIAAPNDFTSNKWSGSIRFESQDREHDDTSLLHVTGVHLPHKSGRADAYIAVAGTVNIEHDIGSSCVIAGDFNVNHWEIRDRVFDGAAVPDYTPAIAAVTTVKGRAIDNVVYSARAHTLQSSRVFTDWMSYSHYPILANF